ncbi:MAG: T9SS type A sorting domain-containing protein [Bacteroidetes bacterium]|nr:T9SS type A sorting domain-containing protein [Bacteroidota bacterium]MBS1974728.1 T9SS type A sorting domain-containing protein [Bacteroidota bacterium]
MKQKSFVIILFLQVWVQLYSQPVVSKQKTIGGNSEDQLGGMWATTDGGMVLGGRSYSYVSFDKTENNRGIDDYWVVKLDKDGKIQWQRTLGGTDVDELLALQQTRDGGYILAGNSQSYISADKADNSKGVFDCWIIKLNSFGSVEWQKTLGGDSYEFCNSIRQTRDGGYIVGCMSNSNISGDKSDPGKGGFDFWVVKLDSKGNKEWDRSLGGSGDEFLNQAIQTSDGGYIAVGLSNSNASGDKTENCRGNNDYWAIKLDRNGNKVWDKTAGGTDNDYVNGVVQTPDGNFILTGASASPISGEKTEASRGGFDFWIVKLNKSGKIIFDRTIGGNGDEFEAIAELTDDGGFILGGNSSSNISGEKTENSRGSFDYWILKFNKNGSISWDKTIGGNGDDNLRSIRQIKKGSYMLGGYSWSNANGDKTEDSYGGNDYWVVNLIDKSQCSDFTATPEAKLLFSSADENISTVFKAYPNPARDQVMIRTNGKATVALTDYSGRVLVSSVIVNNGSINTSGLNMGLYFIKNLTTGEIQKLLISPK